ncbi:MAG: hypothetical protein JJE39_14005 [Vicinamibacteria bacterium]|nr:hypothetical protein [Vicinamibacteria bacterium]
MRLAACKGDDATLALLAQAGVQPLPTEAVICLIARVTTAGGRAWLHRSGGVEYGFLGEEHGDVSRRFLMNNPGWALCRAAGRSDASTMAPLIAADAAANAGFEGGNPLVHASQPR